MCLPRSRRTLAGADVLFRVATFSERLAPDHYWSRTALRLPMAEHRVGLRCDFGRGWRYSTVGTLLRAPAPKVGKTNPDFDENLIRQLRARPSPCRGNIHPILGQTLPATSRRVHWRLAVLLALPLKTRGFAAVCWNIPQPGKRVRHGSCRTLGKQQLYH